MSMASRRFSSSWFCGLALLCSVGLFVMHRPAVALGDNTAPFDFKHFLLRPGDPSASFVVTDMGQVGSQWMPDPMDPKRNGSMPWSVTGQLGINYANRPLKLTWGPEQYEDLIRHRLSGMASVAVSLKERFMVALTMPVTFYQLAGERNPGIPDGARNLFPSSLNATAAGDLILTLKAVLYNSHVAGKTRGVQGGLALVGDLTAPTGNTDAFMGSSLPTFRLGLAWHVAHKWFTMAFNMGALFARPDEVIAPAYSINPTQTRDISLGVKTGHAFWATGGVGFELYRSKPTDTEKYTRVQLTQEFSALGHWSVIFDSANYSNVSRNLAMEWTTGVKIEHATERGDRVGVLVYGGPGMGVVGSGLSGYGVPDGRVGATFSYTRAAARPARQLPPPPPPVLPPPPVEPPPPPPPKKPEPPQSVGQVTISGNRLDLPPIQFDFDRDTITPGPSDAILADAGKLLLNRPDIQHVSIEGHTDNKGSVLYNKDLSERRALAVMQRLIALGVEPGRLSAKGLGLKCPLVPNDSEEARARNRRVEFWIVKIGGSVLPRPPAQCADLTTKPAPAKKPVRRGRRGR